MSQNWPEKCPPLFDASVHARLRLFRLSAGISRSSVRKFLSMVAKTTHTGLFDRASWPAQEGRGELQSVCFTVERAQMWSVYRAIKQDIEQLGPDARLMECFESYERAAARGLTLYVWTMPPDVQNHEVAEAIAEHTGVMPWAVILRRSIGYVVIPPDYEGELFHLELQGRCVKVNDCLADGGQPRFQSIKRWVSRQQSAHLSEPTEADVIDMADFPTLPPPRKPVLESITQPPTEDAFWVRSPFSLFDMMFDVRRSLESGSKPKLSVESVDADIAYYTARLESLRSERTGLMHVRSGVLQ